MKTSRLALFPILSILAIACSSSTSEQPTDTSDEAKTIHPGGREDLGRLLVNYPAGTTVPANPPTVTYWSPSLNQPTQSVAPGTSVRLVPGTWCVQVGNPSAVTTTDCTITITKAVTTNVDLAAVTPRYDASVVQVDFGPTVSVTETFTTPTGGSGGITGVNWTATAPSAPVYMLPGTYTFNYGNANFTPLASPIAGGSTVPLDITPPDKRAHIQVKAPARDYATGLPASACTSGAAYYLMWRTDATVVTTEPQYGAYASTPGTSSTMRFDVANGAASDIKVFPFTASDPATYHYELYLHGQTKSLTVTSGATTTFTPERIDIDDVSVTDEQGNTRTVAGTYQVFIQTANGTFAPIQHNMYYSYYGSCIAGLTTSTYATHQGIDVIAGTYKVITSYADALGAQTETDVVTVP